MMDSGRTGIVVAGLLWLLSAAGCLSGQDHLQKAFAADEADQFPEAVRQYTLAIDSGELSPADLVAGYRHRANACRKQGDLEKALVDYTRAIVLDPRYVAAYNGRGVVHWGRGEIDQAIADYTKAIDLAPKFAAAYNNRGAAYQRKGEYAKAVADYTKAIELDPKFALAYRNRGSVYRKQGQNLKALADFRKARDLGLILP